MPISLIYRWVPCTVMLLINTVTREPWHGQKRNKIIRRANQNAPRRLSPAGARRRDKKCSASTCLCILKRGWRVKHLLASQDMQTKLKRDKTGLKRDISHFHSTCTAWTSALRELARFSADRVQFQWTCRHSSVPMCRLAHILLAGCACG